MSEYGIVSLEYGEQFQRCPKRIFVVSSRGSFITNSALKLHLGLTPPLFEFVLVVLITPELVLTFLINEV